MDDCCFFDMAEGAHEALLEIMVEECARSSPIIARPEGKVFAFVLPRAHTQAPVRQRCWLLAPPPTAPPLAA